MSVIIRSDRPWFDQMRAIAERDAASPADVIPRLFDAVVDWITQRGPQQNGLIRAAVELPYDHPSRSAALINGREIETYFASNLADSGVRRPREAAAEAYLLLVGAIAAAATRHDATHARRAAMRIRRLVAGGEDRATSNH